MSASTLILGCGYLGSRVAERLLGRGDRVFATTRSPLRADEFRSRGIVPILADLSRPAAPLDLPPVDSALYCVGYDRRSGVPMRALHVQGLERVLSALGGLSGRLVFTSTTGVYGQTGGEWVDEDSPAHPATESGRVCLEAEELLRNQAPSATTVLRLSGLYGPGRLIRRAALQAGEPISADPDGFLNLIHVDDAARAVLAALDDRASKGFELFVVSDDRPVRRREFYGELARLLDAPEPRFSPAPPDESDKRVRNARLKRRLGFEPRYPDIASGLPASIAVERLSTPG